MKGSSIVQVVACVNRILVRGVRMECGVHIVLGKNITHCVVNDVRYRMANPVNVVNVYEESNEIVCLKCSQKLGIVLEGMYYLREVADS